MKTLFLDFRHLHIPEQYKQQLKESVTETVRQKYEDTETFVTNNPDAQELASQSGEVKSVLIHNDQSIDASDSSLGEAFAGEGVAGVDVSDFILNGLGQDMDILAKQVGTIVSHEGFHLLGPAGHSAEPNNLMSEGQDTSNQLAADGGESLEFTDIQKAILREDINYDANSTLGSIEENAQRYLVNDSNDTETQGGDDTQTGGENISDIIEDLIT